MLYIKSKNNNNNNFVFLFFGINDFKGVPPTGQHKMYHAIGEFVTARGKLKADIFKIKLINL